MSYVVQFLLVLLLAVLACTKVTIQGFVSRKHIVTTQDTVWFNALVFTAIAAFLALLFPMGEINGVLVFYALVVTVTTVVFQVCYTIALRTKIQGLGTFFAIELVHQFYIIRKCYAFR